MSREMTKSMFTFKRAERKKSKLRLGITGPSGSGKSYAALTLAASIGSRIAAIDTENGSLSLYADMCEFDTIDLAAPYHPERFTEAIHAAENAGYDVLIIDSITHEWSGSGGCLELNDDNAKAYFKGNNWSAWSMTKPMHRKMLDAIMASPMHIIITMRSKTETAQEGKRVIKLGMKAEQQDNFEYEMTVVLDLVHEGHIAVASKDRTGLFTGKQAMQISSRTGERLLDWLNSGKEPLPQEPLEEDAPMKIQPPAKPPLRKIEPPAEYSNDCYLKAKLAIEKCQTIPEVEKMILGVKLRQEQGLLQHDHPAELLDLCNDMKTKITDAMKTETPEDSELELVGAPV